MDWRFGPVWTPDKTQASAEADAWGGDRADPLRTASSVEVYVANQKWLSARLQRCLLAPGGTGFVRHGSYERVLPPRLRIARRYCRQGHRTFTPEFPRRHAGVEPDAAKQWKTKPDLSAFLQPL